MTAAMVRRETEENGIRIDTAVPERDALMRGDRRATMQVLLNLISNAVKFSHSGGVVSIRIEQRTGGGFTVEIADNGIGIDPAVLPKLFQPFTQADTSISRRYGGSGLGLAICDRLVASHGGSLSIESVLGRGTMVRIAFPASRDLSRRKESAAAV